MNSFFEKWGYPETMKKQPKPSKSGIQTVFESKVYQEFKEWHQKQDLTYFWYSLRVSQKSETPEESYLLKAMEKSIVLKEKSGRRNFRTKKPPPSLYLGSLSELSCQRSS